MTIGRCRKERGLLVGSRVAAWVGVSERNKANQFSRRPNVVSNGFPTLLFRVFQFGTSSDFGSLGSPPTLLSFLPTRQVIVAEPPTATGTYYCCNEGTTEGCFEVGDRVMGLVSGAAYAEYVTCPVQLLIPVPSGMPGRRIR